MTSQLNFNIGLKILRVYLKSTALYGFTRAVTWNYEGKKEYYNSTTHRYETKEKLIVDKAVSVLGGTFAAYFSWPSMLCDDLTRLECAVKGRDAGEYGLKFKRFADSGK